MSELVWFALYFVFFAYAGLALVAAAFARRLVFPIPDNTPLRHPGAFFIDAATGRIACLHLPAFDSAAPLVVYHHGNFEDLGRILPRLENLRGLGFAVLAYDYPGYGLSEGRPDEVTLKAAALAVHGHACEALGTPEKQVIHWGRSIGGGPALHIATMRSIGGLILESTFTSTFRVFTKWKVLPWDIFDNLRPLRSLGLPVLILHGMEDRTVPFSHALRLRAESPPGSRHLWIPNAGHNNLQESAPETYAATVRTYVSARVGYDFDAV